MSKAWWLEDMVQYADTPTKDSVDSSFLYKSIVQIYWIKQPVNDKNMRYHSIISSWKRGRDGRVPVVVLW